jgi:hypothetical protein
VQVSHITPVVAYPNGDKDSSTVDDEWAVLQVRTLCLTHQVVSQLKRGAAVVIGR